MAWKFYYFTHILKDESWTSLNVMIDYENVTTDYVNLQKPVKH